MDENKNLAEGMEPLTEAELADVDGGEVVMLTTTYYCTRCGGIAEKYTYFPGYSYKCTSCKHLLKSSECRRITVTHSVDGDAHTVSAYF